MRFYLLVAFTVTHLGALAAAQADKVAFVDLRRAIVECAEGKVAQKTLAAEVDAKQKELDTERAAVKELGTALTKEESTLKGEELEKRRRELREKYYEVERKVSKFKAVLQRKEAETVRPISEKILVVVAAVAQREKVTHILRGETLLWTESQSMDLTNDVIRMADSAYEKARLKATNVEKGDATKTAEPPKKAAEDTPTPAP